VTPANGTSTGGSRLHIFGRGFTVDIYSGSNAVYIGDPSFDYLSTNPTWTPCPVVEGACSVDCGGSRKLVCDSGEWWPSTPSHPNLAAMRAAEAALIASTPGGEAALYLGLGRSRPAAFSTPCDTLYCDGGLLDSPPLTVKVVTRESGTASSSSVAGTVGGSVQSYTSSVAEAYTYVGVKSPLTPTIDDVYPRYVSANDIMTIRGSALGTSVKDYRAIYVGVGRPPVGANLESGANAALCRQESLNPQADKSGRVFGATTAPVSVDDINPPPIEMDVVRCRVREKIEQEGGGEILCCRSRRGGIYVMRPS
jgi:hypothetical protein